jgi:hypothetical protein
LVSSMAPSYFFENLCYDSGHMLCQYIGSCFCTSTVFATSVAVVVRSFKISVLYFHVVRLPVINPMLVNPWLVF